MSAGPPITTDIPDVRRPDATWLGLVVLAAWTISFGAILGGAKNFRSGHDSSLVLVLSASLIQGLVLLLGLLLARHRGPAPTRKVLALIVISGCLARVAALAMPPGLSDDIYRYRWEARVAAAGFNPYRLAPDAIELQALRDELWEPVNHKAIPAIYPPVTLAFFTGLYLGGAGLTGFKLALLALEQALILSVLAQLRGAASIRQGTAALILCWHPLAILETAGQGHFEVLPLLALLLAVIARRSGKATLSGVLAGFAIAAKYIPALLLPALLRSNRPEWRGSRFLFAAVLSLLILFAPLWLDRSAGSLGNYGASWRFNSPGFDALDSLWRETGAARTLVAKLVQPLFAQPGQDLRRHENWLSAPARLSVLVVLSALMAWHWKRRRSPPRAARELFFVMLMVSPVVHPWYGLWLWPWLAIQPRLAPLLLTLLLPLSYEVLLRYQGTPATWSEASWVRILIFAPPLLMLLMESRALRRLLKSSSGPASEAKNEALDSLKSRREPGRIEGQV